MGRMSDPNPPVPDPTNPEQPQQPADDTTALPQADGAVGAGAADTAALPPQPGPASPGWGPAPAAGAPTGYGPVRPPTAAPSGPAKWWNEATSTGGGRAAVAGVAVLAALFLVAGLGLTAALVVSHHRGGDDHGFITRSRDAEGMGPQQGPGMGRGNGNKNGNKNGNGNGWRQGDVPRPAPRQADPALPGNGKGNGLGLGRGAGGLGAVLHGEFTTNLTGTPTVMVVQTGQVTAYTAGKSLTVKSTDGFEATYTLDGTAVTAGPDAAQLANGVQVRVIAAKNGMKVTALSIG
jgi:hypothetical protein